jgi:hypothetical protein
MRRHTGNDGATGIVIKRMKTCLQTIVGKLSLEFTKIAVLGTSHIIREMLKSET